MTHDESQVLTKVVYFVETGTVYPDGVRNGKSQGFETEAAARKFMVEMTPVRDRFESERRKASGRGASTCFARLTKGVFELDEEGETAGCVDQTEIELIEYGIEDYRRDKAKRAQSRYRREHVTQVMVKFYPGDADLLAWLDAQGARATYIKRLIREDMERCQG